MTDHDGARPGYDDRFYGEVSRTARGSARALLPVLFDYVRPASVVDVGCGTGAWLAVFREMGVANVLGIDGGFCAESRMEIPADRYRVADLAKPLRHERTFDLAMSLEVAEHLPAASAEAFVGSLTALAPVVLFSAAIPGQGGTHHVNEQWPAYWAALFGVRGYVAVDCIRRRVWEDDAVAWWYAQNVILFCEAGWLARATPALRAAAAAEAAPLPLVHPKKLAEALWQADAARIAGRVAAALPAEARFLLVDGGAYGDAFGGRAIPFPERDGVYNGEPAYDEEAIAELRRLAPSADFLVVTAPARWWLDYYRGWREVLECSYPLHVSEPDLLVFDLRT